MSERPYPYSEKKARRVLQIRTIRFNSSELLCTTSKERGHENAWLIKAPPVCDRWYKMLKDTISIVILIKTAIFPGRNVKYRKTVT